MKLLENIEEWNAQKKNGDTKYRYPKNFFTGNDGIKRAHLLLNEQVSLYLSSLTLREQYEFFASNEAMDWIKSKNLGEAIGKIYKDPLEYFHDSLPLEKQSNFYFYANMINRLYLSYATGKKRRR